MPRKLCVGLMAFLLLGLMAETAMAQRSGRQGQRRARVRPEVGKIVKDFTLLDTKGTTVTLSKFRDKIFILELGACT